MRLAGWALPFCLAAVIGALPAIWTATAEAQEAEESEDGADEIATPKIYKWIDEHGIAHYTTDFKRIPDDLRDRAGRLGPPDATLSRPSVEPSAPPRRTPTAPSIDEGEQWAVRDRAFDRPRDLWDEGDPYADVYQDPLEPVESGEDDLATKEADLAAREADREQRRLRLEDIEEQIASIRTDIADAEEALKVLVAIPVPEGGGPLAMADDPQFREVATLLPKLLADLRALEDERAELQAP